MRGAILGRVTVLIGIVMMIGMVVVPIRPLHGQLSMPNVEATWGDNGMNPQRASHPVTAAEAAQQLRIQAAQLELAISFRDTHYPKDSMLAVLATSAAQRLTQLPSSAVRGLQHDPAGSLGVVAQNRAYAEQQVALRLATPGLALPDRAYTYLIAVQAWANYHYPERLPIAEHYLQQLDALGDTAAPWQFFARSALLDTYYLLGRSADVVRLGTQALQRLTVMPYADRWPGILVSVYEKTVEALAATPDGPAQIARVNALIRSTFPPPPELAALDSEVVWNSRRRADQFKYYLDAVSRLGTQGPPLIANYWVNRPTPDSAEVRLNDGTIRVVETFQYACDGCLMALHGLQRLKAQFPNIEVLGLTWTDGWWGNRLVEPQDEAERLNHYFTQQLRVTFPIGIWKSAKVLHDDGGLRAENTPGPNNAHYPIITKPTIWVFDGHGRVRRVVLGGGRDIEQHLARTIEFLTREATAQGSAVSLSVARP